MPHRCDQWTFFAGQDPFCVPSFYSLSFLGILKNEYVLIDSGELIWDEKRRTQNPIMLYVLYHLK